MIINNRDSAPDITTYSNSHSRSTSPNKLYQLNKSSIEQHQKQKKVVLEELVAPKSPPTKMVIIEPAVVIVGTPAPFVEHTNRPVTIMTQKSVETKILGDNRNCGVIKLTVHYDELRHRLSITCHQAQ